MSHLTSHIKINKDPEIDINIEDIMLNLSDDTPEFYSQFQRLIEIVVQNNKQNARERYKKYRENNCKLTKSWKLYY